MSAVTTPDDAQFALAELRHIREEMKEMSGGMHRLETKSEALLKNSNTLIEMAEAFVWFKTAQKVTLWLLALLASVGAVAKFLIPSIKEFMK